ncbi:hypothetical protein [Azohydromonas australica]|uniref:hypothetical protein n=1 Tax=Azohydromonas australica TaxID=364039 RepID=UPI0012EB9450|nr:hypothetical protein [Azohydromonas australica]
MPINGPRSVATFAKAAEFGSLRQAVAGRGMTPQIASQPGAGAIGAALGRGRFHRTTCSLALTNESQQFSAIAQRALTALQQALQCVLQAKKEAVDPTGIAGPCSDFLSLL